jgi:hypothetical protein
MAMNTSQKPIAKSIGDNTHHHDHVMTPRSFNVIKTIVRSPTKPIPALELELE